MLYQQRWRSLLTKSLTGSPTSESDRGAKTQTMTLVSILILPPKTSLRSRRIRLVLQCRLLVSVTMLRPSLLVPSLVDESSVRSRSSQSSRRTSPRSQSRSRSPSPTTSSTGRPRSQSQSESSKRATPVSSPPSSVQASPSASKVLKDDRPPELIDLTSDVEMSSSPEDSPPATPRAERGTRDLVPSPTGGKTVPEAPAPLAEASSVTKEIPDSGPPSSPPPKATPSAVPGDEDEGTTFHDLVALFRSDDDDEDQRHSAQASSLSATHRPSGVTSLYRSSSDNDDSSDDEGPRDPSIAKRPSLPASPSSTPKDIDDNGGHSR
ncbi:hypothetical protein JG688_00018533 [Phytophthora aleatoria]|uniref:Uncharacterized protein n=1 Tax=Phytophthora aleatoria TaxID=2496075 RepID=A0A8J5I247_9STRA|nr:hypothetical protein JG688_00018533 [Phytophthora aleatoria]